MKTPAKTGVRIALTVNGRERLARVPPMKRLLDVLREDLALPGTKEGCGEGECGACSVLMNGASVCACLVPAVQCEGAKIVTVEGLARGARLSALQQAFIDLGGAQCGICTPGMLITASELLRRAKGRVPTDGEVREALAGNLCRCTGYQKIVDAVRAAARTTGAKTRRTGSAAARAARVAGTKQGGPTRRAKSDTRAPGPRPGRKAARSLRPRRAAR